MRNVIFGIMLVALAVVQIAVVSTELSHSGVKVATAERDQIGFHRAGVNAVVEL